MMAPARKRERRDPAELTGAMEAIGITSPSGATEQMDAPRTEQQPPAAASAPPTAARPAPSRPKAQPSAYTTPPAGGRRPVRRVPKRQHTYALPPEVGEEVRNAVDYLQATGQDVSVNAFVEDALRAHLSAEAAAHGLDRWPERTR